ncbi:MAG: hypothetical protein K5669_10510 [Lachnospiraceae bacterium]|nr:hypothetical protein [Lachnospiraceae bacterium]
MKKLKELKKKLMAMLTSVAMVVGMVAGGLGLAPMAAYADTVTYFTIDGYDATGTVTYPIGNENVILTFDQSRVDNDGKVSITNDQASTIVAALNEAVTNVSGFNSETMQAYFEASDGFKGNLTCTEGTFAGDFGLPVGLAITFHIAAKDNNSGGGEGGGQAGGNSQAHVTMSSDGGDWHGQPCVRENYNYYEDMSIDWNCQAQNSYRLVSLFVNNNNEWRSGAGFEEDGQAVNERDIYYDAKDDPSTVDLTFKFNFGYRPYGDDPVIKINNTDYHVNQYVDLNTKAGWLDALIFDRNVDFGGLAFTIPNVPANIDGQGIAQLNIVCNFRPSNFEECYIANYGWGGTDPNEDTYIGNSTLTVYSVQYPADLGGQTYSFSTIQTEAGYTEAQKSAQYVLYESNDRGSGMLIPVGSIVTMGVAPNFGYQVTEFTINNRSITRNDFGTSDDVAVFTFEVTSGNYHVGARVDEVDNEVATDSASGISAGAVEIGAGDSSMSIGSALLEVEDVTVSEEQVANFANAAGEYEVSSYVDISLFNKVCKGTTEDAWITPVNSLSSQATISLALNEDVSGKEVVIVHELSDGTYEVIPTEYISEYNAIVFETSSFSNYAIALRDGTPTPADQDSQDSQDNQEGQQSGSGNKSFNDKYMDTLSDLSDYIGELGVNSDTTIVYSGGDSIPEFVMAKLKDCPNVSIEFSYTYEGVKYDVLITGKRMAELYDETIPWYGPLWLAQYFSR